MDLFEAIEKRRSCRSLKPVDVPRSDLEKIIDAGRRAPSGMNTQPFSFVIITERETIEKLSKAQSFISGASVAIAIVADGSKSKYWLEDISAAAENMLLAITALGYASTWVEGTLLRVEDEMKELLGVPKDLRLMILLPIGAPASEGAQAPKKSFDEIISWERYEAK